MTTLNRRTLLKLGALTLGASAVSACANTQHGLPPGVGVASERFTPDIELSLKALPGTAQILPGATTNTWSYQAQLQRGEASALTIHPNRFLGPHLRVKRGQKVRVRFSNGLPAGQVTNVHWHGLLVPDSMDGHPRHVIDPGQTFVYEFEVKNRPGLYWFHPHPHVLTGQQVYRGLAGLLQVEDDAATAATLPTGEFDLPIVIQDRLFDAANQLLYPAQTETGQQGGMNHGGMGGMNMQSMMAGMMGALGDTVLVNGQKDASLEVGPRPYRLRFFNASNARIYKLAWSNGEPFNVIGTDGGLLDRPVTRPYLMLAPAQRIEIWVDFKRWASGQPVTLESGAFETGEAAGMMASSAPELGAPMRVMTVRVSGNASSPLTLPASFPALDAPRIEQATNAAAPRRFTLTLNGMQWLINGRSFEMDKVAADEVVTRGATEVWEFVNALNPGHMMEANGMPHPIHIHGTQFTVLGRSTLPELQKLQDGTRDGLVDTGLHDTVLVMPGESVKLLMQFNEAGRFLFHCHNLEHESQGMMRNVDVRA
ncbi:MAG: multicopper oxidase family protein [Thermoflexales bacterium]|nr:multicopper oxidase family protein [Thermoflexales bacterium]